MHQTHRTRKTQNIVYIQQKENSPHTYIRPLGFSDVHRGTVFPVENPVIDESSSTGRPNWIRHLTSNQGILGSSPRRGMFFFGFDAGRDDPPNKKGNECEKIESSEIFPAIT